MTTTQSLPGTQTAAPTRLARSTRRLAPVIARWLLGLIFFVFGLNGLLNFLPPPASGVPARAMAFGAALMQTGYLFQLLKGTEVICGMLLLANRCVPLALAVLAPVIVNIVAFHLFLAPSGLSIALPLLVVELYLAWAYRGAFKAMLSMRATPEAS